MIIIFLKNMGFNIMNATNSKELIKFIPNLDTNLRDNQVKEYNLLDSLLRIP